MSRFDSIVIGDIMNYQKQMDWIWKYIFDQLKEGVYLLVAFTEQDKQTDYNSFCIFYRLIYNGNLNRNVQNYIVQTIARYFMKIDNNNSEITIPNLISSYFKQTNRNVIYVECRNNKFYTIEQNQPEFNNITNQNKHPKLNILNLQKHNNFSCFSLKKQPKQIKHIELYNLISQNNLQPKVQLRQQLPKLSERNLQSVNQKISHVDSCINQLQTQRYSDLINQVKYSSVKKDNYKDRLYTNFSQNVQTDVSTHQFFVNYCYTRI